MVFISCKKNSKKTSTTMEIILTIDIVFVLFEENFDRTEKSQFISTPNEYNKVTQYTRDRKLHSCSDNHFALQTSILQYNIIGSIIYTNSLITRNVCLTRHDQYGVYTRTQNDFQSKHFILHFLLLFFINNHLIIECITI